MTKWKFAIYNTRLKMWLPTASYYSDAEFETYANENSISEDKWKKLDFTAKEF